MMAEMTKSEREVMRLLWNSSDPLSCTEIVNASPDKHWKDSYIHHIVNDLIKKGYIKIVAFEQVSRVYTRKFAPRQIGAPLYFIRYSLPSSSQTGRL